MLCMKKNKGAWGMKKLIILLTFILAGCSSSNENGNKFKDECVKENGILSYEYTINSLGFESLTIKCEPKAVNR